jgi:hypothetical protein
MNQVYRNTSAHGPVTELCYVSHDIEHTMSSWIALVGAGPFFIHEFTLDVDCDGKRSAVEAIVALGASGSTIIEIIQPKGAAPSLFSERLNGKGACLYALKCDTRDFHAEAEKLHGSGHAPIASIHQWDGGRSDYFSIATMPFLVKAVMQGSSFDGIPEALREAHRNWDRTRPVRHLSKLHPRLSFSYAALGLAGT